VSGGIYRLTLTSNQPGPGVGVDFYESCQSGGIVTGSRVYLTKGEKTATEATKPLEAGCHTLFLSNLLDASVIVRLAR
jgi:hypothetical protein